MDCRDAQFYLRMRRHAADDANYERRTAKDGSPYFVLVASNKQEIGRSEMYSGAAAMENGIALICAPDSSTALNHNRSTARRTGRRAQVGELIGSGP